MLYNDQSSLKSFCAVCFKTSHHFFSCPLIHLSLNIERIIRTNNEKIFSYREYYSRSLDRRLNTRQKLKKIQAEAIVFIEENWDEV